MPGMREGEVLCISWERSWMFVMQLRKILINKYSLDFHCFISVLSSVPFVIYQVVESHLQKETINPFFCFYIF